MISEVDWDAGPERQSRRGCRRVDHSPSRSGWGGDYCFYDPYAKAFIDEAGANTRRDFARVALPGGPSGFVFIEDECLARRVADANRSAHLAAVAALVPTDPAASEPDVDVPESAPDALAGVCALLVGVGVDASGVTSLEEATALLQARLGGSPSSAPSASGKDAEGAGDAEMEDTPVGGTSGADNTASPSNPTA